MNSVLRFCLGLGLGAGMLFVWCGIRGVRLIERRHSRSRRRTSRDETALVEALAVWIEQLRDTMAGARGLEQALTATSTTAPSPLRPAVQRMSSRLGMMPLPRALRGLATDIDHPLADFVTAALIVAAENHVRDLVNLLSHLSACCRDDVRMRTRVWVARARIRSAIRIIGAVIVVFVMGLVLLQRDYLRPYFTPSGSIVLLVVLAFFVSALVLLSRLGRFDAPSRFISRENGVAA